MYTPRFKKPIKNFSGLKPRVFEKKVYDGAELLLGDIHKGRQKIRTKPDVERGGGFEVFGRPKLKKSYSDFLSLSLLKIISTYENFSFLVIVSVSSCV